MDAIEHIIRDIDTQAAAERANLEKERREEIDTSFLIEQKKLAKQQQDYLSQQEKQLERKFQQEKNRIAVQARQAQLKQKQSYLERLFEMSYQVMADWSAEEAQMFAKKQLQQAHLTSGKLLPGKLLADTIYSAEWVAQLNEQLDATFELGSKTAEREHGFLIEQATVRYNFFYRELLTEIKNQQGHKLLTKLFAEQN